MHLVQLHKGQQGSRALFSAFIRAEYSEREAEPVGDGYKI